MRAVFALLACAVATDAGLNPITRVAELLEGLAKKVRMDGDAEQELYDHYKCWCTKVINGKTASISKNDQRIKELSALIDDLGSGRIELTSERSDLEKEIKTLEKDISEAETMREKEHEDYLAAKDEMDKAVTALTSAVSTLKDATEEPAAEFAKLKSSLNKVMNVGQGFLAKADITGLSKLLDVPTADWKKLNRDATFKQKYSASSGDIQGILGDMLNTFTDNRDEAVSAEEKAVTDFTALMEGKEGLLSSAKQAMLDKAGEGGARATALSDAEQEKEDLQGQNTRDEGFLTDTETACDTKATEWGERKSLRAAEVASIGEAISILRSDDARDTFKKSFDSQSFIQLEKRHGKNHRRKQALSMIRKLAAATKDSRMASLSTALAMEVPAELENESNPFVEVIGAIDTMLESLKTEEADDLSTKEQCEKERMENTQEAKTTSKEIDTNTETMDRLNAQIAAALKKIKEIEEEVTELGEQKTDATEQRAKENGEYLSAKADDEKAVELVGSAIEVLKKFRTDNALDLVQVRRAKQEPFVEAGEAPTPPPTTFEGGYGGAKGESNGIVAIMEMISGDITKDITKATTDEAESVTAYDKVVADIDASVESLEGTKSDTNTAMAADDEALILEKETKNTNQVQLDSTLTFLKSIAKGCDFMAVNFNTRLTNRQAETDGLNKAKAILQGAGAN